MEKPFDAYVAQQERKAKALEDSIRADERARIIALLDEKLYEDDECSCEACSWVRKVFALIRDENIAPEIPQFEGTRAQIDALTIKGEG